MKKLFILILSTVSFSALATQWSVSNNPTVTASFTQITTAIASSSVVAGDTLIVQPSAAEYTNFNLNKSLTIIGSGFNPSKTNPLTTKITSNSCTVSVNNCKFIGITFTSPIYYTSIIGFTIQNCYLNGNAHILPSSSPMTITNLILRNNIMQGVVDLNSKVGSSAFISNCVIHSGYITNSIGSLTVSQCTFIGSLNSMTNITSALFQNCIFKGFSFPGFHNSVTNSSFIHCLTHGYTNNTIPPSGMGNTGSNNLTNVDPQLTNVPNMTFNMSTTNYHLNTGSLALTAGTTGGQLGVYGNGTFTMTGEPYNSSVIRSFQINNVSVPVNGNLNINLNVTNPNTN